ncbi:MAG TPA: polysaccharide deacetylase family protein [Syntrophobacteraceae bacterium]|mgnify:CR=1 FL=1|nr:polysaccharide deacetylase family protein [Syntrophobacteraceae bacterium]
MSHGKLDEWKGHLMVGRSSPPLDDFGLTARYRPRRYSALWEQPQQDWREKLASALECNPGDSPPGFFFRADDIGSGGRHFHALCELFRRHNTPLAMAVVPAWLTAARIELLFAAAPLEESLWGWHQHGWRHINLQQAGRKSEFGDQRPIEKQWQDISQGSKKMTKVFGNRSIPVFTPPWNRLSTATLKVLKELHFRAVSLDGPMPGTVKHGVGFKNLRIQLDLHTRKEKNGEADFDNLLGELCGLMTQKAPVGIMLHHQRMTLFAFEFLDELLHCIKHKLYAQCLSFEELLENE